MRLNLASSTLGNIIEVGPGIYVIKTLVAIGGGSGKLSHKGLRQRFLSNLDGGNEEEIMQVDEFTTPDMLDEEIEYLEAVRHDAIESFDIDTTTTIVKLDDGSLVLHSPAEATFQLVAEVLKLGDKVSAIIAPNLQHWLGCSSWAKLCPNAEIYVAPEAEGECLVEKLGLQGSPRAKILNEKGSLFDGQLTYSLLKGAPLMLNEVVFFHTKSSTLIVADAFYSGHCCTHYGQTNPKPENQSNLEKKSEVMPPNAFTRIWFKMTKDHWCSPQLPSYRTTRVLSNGNPEVLLSCIKSIIKEWAPSKMICAHGDRIVDENPGAALIHAWTKGVLPSKSG